MRSEDLQLNRSPYQVVATDAMSCLCMFTVAACFGPSTMHSCWIWDARVCWDPIGHTWEPLRSLCCSRHACGMLQRKHGRGFFGSHHLLFLLGARPASVLGLRITWHLVL